jgi:hypothetical protein
MRSLRCAGQQLIHNLMKSRKGRELSVPGCVNSEMQELIGNRLAG